jgi:hypothetical protein
MKQVKMKQKKVYETVLTMEVRHGNEFPIDMLRYSSCMPLTEADSTEIAASLDVAQPPKNRTVRLLRRAMTPKLPMNELNRWHSYHCFVVTEEDKEGRSLAFL